jgi:formate dehydrogenase major subunit
MGCEPGHLTGYATIEQGRPSFERVWGAAIPKQPGLDLMQMMDAAQAGQLKALYAIGYDVLLTNPNANLTRQALATLELLIVQDMFLNETAREFASVVLPASSSFEKDGTFMSSERRVQRVRRALCPPGEARGDWEIICELAGTMGHHQGFEFGCSQDVWNEVRLLWGAGAGLSYERLEQQGLQWPCPSEDHPGTRVLHQHTFANGGRARLRRIEPRPALEPCSEEYPLVLVTGRKLHQFNAGTMTGRTPNLVFQPADVLDVSPDDARRYRLEQGQHVVLRSRYGHATIAVNIDAAQRPGEVFATFHMAETFVNRVTSSQRDTIVNTPEYKVTAVRLEYCPTGIGTSDASLPDRSTPP